MIGLSAADANALASMALAFQQGAETAGEPGDAGIGFGPFDPEEALRMELTEQRRSILFGDLLGAAMLAGAALWSVAANLA